MRKLHILVQSQEQQANCSGAGSSHVWPFHSHRADCVADDAGGKSPGAGRTINQVFLLSNQKVRALLDSTWMKKYTVQALEFLPELVTVHKWPVHVHLSKERSWVWPVDEWQSHHNWTPWMASRQLPERKPHIKPQLVGLDNINLYYRAE